MIRVSKKIRDALLAIEKDQLAIMANETPDPDMTRMLSPQKIEDLRRDMYEKAALIKEYLQTNT